jgi:hypothetical protein
MKGKDLIKLIKESKLEDYDIFYMEIDESHKDNYISACTNYRQLPYPEFVDFMANGVAEQYESRVVKFNVEDGSIIKITDAHVDSSTSEFYPY